MVLPSNPQLQFTRRQQCRQQVPSRVLRPAVGRRIKMVQQATPFNEAVLSQIVAYGHTRLMVTVDENLRPTSLDQGQRIVGGLDLAQGGLQKLLSDATIGLNGS